MSTVAPEIVLKRAEELVQQGEIQTAIEILQEVIQGRKTKQSSSIQEKLITFLVDICCQQFNIEALKDCLLAYRQLTQNLNPQGLENVLVYFRETTERSVNELMKNNPDFIPEVLEDTPESLNFFVPQGSDDIKARAFKFQWEAYKFILDILKTNKKLEKVYQTTAQQLFSFCQKFKKSFEVNKIAEMFHQHLLQAKRANEAAKKMSYTPPYLIKIDEKQTVEKMIQLRFELIEIAFELKQWSAAIKVCEDINILFSFLNKKDISVQLQVQYYKILAQAFWHTGHKLFHSYALLLHYSIYRRRKKEKSLQLIQRLSSEVVLSILILQDQVGPMDLYTLLNNPITPSREQLHIEMKSRGIIQDSHQIIQQLHQFIESEFIPTKSNSHQYFQILDQLKEFKEDEQYIYQQYIPNLQEIFTFKMFQQLRKCYQRVSFSFLNSLFPCYTQNQICALLLQWKHCLIDCQNKAVHFIQILPDDAFGNFSSLINSQQTLVHLDKKALHEMIEREKDKKKKESQEQVEISQERVKLKEQRELAEKLQREEEQKAELDRLQKQQIEQTQKDKILEQTKELQKKQREYKQIIITEILKKTKEPLIIGKKKFETPESIQEEDLDQIDDDQVQLLNSIFIDLEKKAKIYIQEKLSSVKHKFLSKVQATQRKYVNILQEMWQQNDAEQNVQALKQAHEQKYQKDLQMKNQIIQYDEVKKTYENKIKEQNDLKQAEAEKEWKKKILNDLKIQILEKAKQAQKQQKQKEEELKKKQEQEQRASKEQEQAIKQVQKEKETIEKGNKNIREPKMSGEGPKRFTNTKKQVVKQETVTKEVPQQKQEETKIASQTQPSQPSSKNQGIQRPTSSAFDSIKGKNQQSRPREETQKSSQVQEGLFGPKKSNQDFKPPFQGKTTSQNETLSQSTEARPSRFTNKNKDKNKQPKVDNEGFQEVTK